MTAKGATARAHLQNLISSGPWNVAARAFSMFFYYVRFFGWRSGADGARFRRGRAKEDHPTEWPSVESGWRNNWPNPLWRHWKRAMRHAGWTFLQFFRTVSFENIGHSMLIYKLKLSMWSKTRYGPMISRLRAGATLPAILMRVHHSLCATLFNSCDSSFGGFSAKKFRLSTDQHSSVACVVALCSVLTSSNPNPGQDQIATFEISRLRRDGMNASMHPCRDGRFLFGAHLTVRRAPIYPHEERLKSTPDCPFSWYDLQSRK